MLLTVIGCAGSVPSPDSPCSCYLVEQDGYRLLLDLGTGAAGPLQAHCAPEQVDLVVISHLHGDHFRDLNPLAYLRRRVGAAPLPVIGPADLAESLGYRERVAELDITMAQPGKRSAGPFALTLAAVEHGHLEAYGVRVDALCYTGDTSPGEAVDQLAAGCQVLLAEASGFDAKPHRKHLTAGDAGRLATRSGARLLVLTHLRPWLDHKRLLAEAAAHADCPVVLATPGLRLQL
jgi:ribonuclease BN (tRNA processing enzyme)